MAASARKALPFFSLLWKESSFEWILECEEVFQNFKEYLSSPSILHKLELSRPLYLYLSVSDVAIASAHIQEDAKQQHPIYFVIKAL